MHLEGHGQSMCRGTGQSGAGHELRERRWSGGQGIKYANRFVQDANSAIVFHDVKLPSQGVRMARTLADKVWDTHVVGSTDGTDLLYIDLHLVHEVTSPQAFDGLRLTKRKLRRPDLTLATEDHNVPTTDTLVPIADPVSRTQVETLRKNCAEFGVRLYPMNDPGQGIVHVVGPQLGLTQPGMTVVCGDSHTSTHGAFGAIAFGIGTSEVEHVMATQTLPNLRPKMMAVNVEGELPVGVTAKDIVLAIIAEIGTGGGQGHIIEYRGSAIRGLSMEGRMTVCNMSIEAGARAGLIAPDETTFAYVKGRPHAPKGAAWDEAVAAWRELQTDDDGRLRHRDHHRRGGSQAVRYLGHQPGAGHHARQHRAGPGVLRRRRPAWGGGAGTRVHGPRGRYPDPRHLRRHRLRRLLHQRAHRGPSGRRRGPRGPAGGVDRTHADRPGLHAGEVAGREGGPGQGLHPPRAPSGAARAARCASG